jgi:hypothetical protein
MFIAPICSEAVLERIKHTLNDCLDRVVKDDRQERHNKEASGRRSGDSHARRLELGK